VPIYRVARREGTAADPAPKIRLIKAERRAQVESFLIGEVEIEKANSEETHELGKQGVEVEDATMGA